ncbi:hypothetical protein [Streptomyces fagopyri]|uniref:hypothetical protein n=1 Tax=Streptomyces fagopyri TaxID=2662397 RepID=UPI00381F8D69
MKRTLIATAAMLLATLTACGSSADTSQPNSDHAAVQTPAKKAKPPATKTPAQKDCGPSRGDVITWSKVPGLPDSAQLIGGFNPGTCRSTFDDLPNESPTQAGYCTLAAWARDNPGYDADARPAKRPRKVQVSVGPDC